MDRTTFKLDLRPRWVMGLVENVQEHFRREAGVEYPREVVEQSLNEWLEVRFDRMMESVGEMITSPHLKESVEFRSILDANAARVTSPTSEAPGRVTDGATASAGVPVGTIADPARAGRDAHLPAASTETTIFTGRRPFDQARLGAMVAYLVAKGHDIYKTNLNKLLFYSDMTAYVLRGQGMSGATYVNMPFGPVPDHVEAVIEALTAAGTISRRDVPEVGKNAVRFELTGEGAAASLSQEDKEVLDWVLATYGEMGAGELSELSHQERAYRDTRPLEPIAYEYAKFLRRLPGNEVDN